MLTSHHKPDRRFGLTHFIGNQRGQAYVEGALLLVLIVLISIAVMKQIGARTSSAIEKVNSAFSPGGAVAASASDSAGKENDAGHDKKGIMGKVSIFNVSR